MSDDNDIIDVEAVEVEDSDHLPAVVAREATHEHAEPIAKWSEAWWAAQSLHTQSRRCRAHSSRTGEPCKNMALTGQSTCRFHGGAAKHVKAAARTRIENAAELMAKQLLGIAVSAESEAVRLNAIRDALDRAGLKPPSEVVLSQGETKPYEQVFVGIGGTPPDESSDLSSGYGSAGGQPSPAPAYDTHADGWQAEAGGGVEGQGGIAADDADRSSRHAPPRQADRRDDGSDRQPENRDGASSPTAPAPREIHITGMAAIRMANEANRDSGVWDEQKAIESPHKGYRRP